MTISELIEYLEQIKKEDGDLKVNYIDIDNYQVDLDDGAFELQCNDGIHVLVIG